MEIHVKIDNLTYVHFICTKYTWDLITKMYTHYLKISLKEQNKKKFTQDTLFSKQYQRISEQLI
jgi:hypothetical protein